MPQFPLTTFDLAALAVIGLSMLVGFMRGVIRESLTIVTWLGAGVVAFYAFPYAREVARRTIETAWMADAAALCVVFVVPLIGFKVAAAALVDHIPHGAFGGIDRFVGAAFGAARGAILVSAAYLGMAVLVAPEDHPEWVKDALILPYVKDGAALLSRLMPEEFAARGVAAPLRMPRDQRRVPTPSAGTTAT